MQIVEADKTRKQEIDEFYKLHGYHSGWSDTERAFTCISDGVVVGSVKVELIEGVTILRGMYIDISFQRRGIGRTLLKTIEPVLNQSTAYCMPLSHLTEFYKQIGFCEVLDAEYPEFLQKRCTKYRELGYSIATMHREKFA